MSLKGLNVHTFLKNNPFETTSKETIKDINLDFKDKVIYAQAADEVVLCIKLGDAGVGFIKSDLASSIAEEPLHILEKVIKERNVEPKDIIVIIPPCLTFSHNPVDEATAKKVVDLGYFPAAKGTSSTLFIDTPLLNVLQLRKLGIPFDNILISSMDTYENPDLFYSKARGNDHQNLIEISIE